MKKSFQRGVSLLALASVSLALPGFAQETVPTADQEDQRTLNRVVVTGSFIRRPDQSSLASPVTTLGAPEIGAIGAQSIADITQTLTINTGAQNNPDAFTQGGTTGTANINLRGLGLQSTLVLTNGKRNVLNASQTNDGISFVDTNSLVPLIAIERLEILKDGASALYGSDAVAGVANFITVTDYDGIKVSGDYQFHTPSGQTQNEYRIEGLVGKTFDRGSALLAASYFDRSPLTTDERRLSVPFAQDVSALGNPGAFFLLPAPGSPLAGLAGLPLIDPTGCGDQGGNPLLLAPPGAGGGLDIGLCQFDFGDFFNLVPDEQRINVFGEVKYNVTDDIEFSINGSYTDLNAERGNSPTFPFLQPAVILADTPTNVFSGIFGPINASFFGRAIGNGGAVSPAPFNSETYRFSTTLKSENFLDNGFWELSYTRAQNDFTNTTEDTITSRFQCALNGLQGTAAPNPSTGGTTDCSAASLFATGETIPLGQIFNPFSTSFTTTPNSPELLDFIIGEQIADNRSQIDVVDAIFGTDIIDLPAGPLAIAAGAQYRNDSLRSDFNDVSNADGLGFLIGNNDFSGSLDVYALFAEVSVPVLDWVDLQAAVRYEDFGGDIGSTVDPKVALLVRPFDGLSLRSTYSTSFRAPTTFQQFGSSTSLNNVVDPVSGAAAFAAVRAFGTEGSGIPLDPETSRAFTAGFTFAKDNFVFNFDWYDISFEDAITQESFQALVAANPTDTRTFAGGVATQPCIGSFTIVCRAGDPASGTITQVNTQFVNADSIDTSGIDYSFRYTYDAGQWGVLTPSFEGTLIIDYDLVDPSAGLIAGAGNRNFTNIGSPTPQTRWNAGLGYANGPVFANFFARRIGGLDDDQNAGARVAGQTRFDIQGGVDVSQWIGFSESSIFTVQVSNLTNEEPPFVATGGGFESRVHDPRGRLVRFGIRTEF